MSVEQCVDLMQSIAIFILGLTLIVSGGRR